MLGMNHSLYKPLNKRFNLWYIKSMGEKWNKSKLDFEQLRIEVQCMTRDSKLYDLLQEELTKLDHWKQQKRGNPKKGYLVSRHAKNI